MQNIALDSGNKITQSIPLGHLGDFNSMYNTAAICRTSYGV